MNFDEWYASVSPDGTDHYDRLSAQAAWSSAIGIGATLCRSLSTEVEAMGNEATKRRAAESMRERCARAIEELDDN